MSEDAICWLWFWAGVVLLIYSESKHPTTWEDIVNRFRFWGYMLWVLLILAGAVAVAASPLVAIWAAMHFWANA